MPYLSLDSVSYELTKNGVDVYRDNRSKPIAHYNCESIDEASRKFENSRRVIHRSIEEFNIKAVVRKEPILDKLKKGQKINLGTLI